MTDQERIESLEARVAELESLVAQIRDDLQYDPIEGYGQRLSRLTKRSEDA